MFWEDLLTGAVVVVGVGLLLWLLPRLGKGG